MTKNYLLALCMGVSMLASVKLQAQVANDACSSATSLSVGNTCSPTNGTFAAATQEIAPDSCAGIRKSTASKDVWYMFTAAQANETIEIGGAGQAPFLFLSSSCGGATIACASPTYLSGTVQLNATNLNPGSTYYVRSYNFAIPGTVVDGSFTICVYNTPMPPANDVCNNATTLTVGSTCNPVNGTYASAVAENPADSCSGLPKPKNANDVWYKFVATGANITVDMTSTAQAPIMNLYSGCGGTVLACANPTYLGGTVSFNTTNLTTGSTYYIRTYNYSSANGTFTICAYTTPPPPTPPANDDCSGAITINPAMDEGACGTYTTVNTVAATQSTPHASCANSSSDDDVWYKFTANDTTMTIHGQNFGAGIAAFGASLFAGSCAGTEDAIDCIAGSPDYIDFHGLTPGNVYYFDIFTNGTATKGTFNICVFGHDYVAGVASISLNKTLSIYPNPAKDQLHIRFSATSNASVKLVDVKGQEVYTDNSVATNGAYDKVIDMTNIAQGVYMLQITSDKETIVRKVVRD